MNKPLGMDAESVVIAALIGATFGGPVGALLGWAAGKTLLGVGVGAALGAGSNVLLLVAAEMDDGGVTTG